MSLLRLPERDAPHAEVVESPESPDRELLREERRRAVRLLLARPLVTDTGLGPYEQETFALVRRHERWLAGWFADLLGYRLVVEPELARLHKRPAPDARPRPARSPSGTAFDPRRYALLCLVLAALETMDLQTVLSELAEKVQVLAASEEGVAPFELDRHAERQAFVDAVRFLVDLGILALTDGDDTAFVQGHGDALYDVHARPLAQVLAAPVPPSLADGPWELSRESYPETDEGANRRTRHRLMRRLVEEPVLYLDGLDEAERAYLTSQRHYLTHQAHDATGLEVEVRREGLAAVDPAGRLTDLTFPAPGTVAHAALLVAEELARHGRSELDGGRSEDARGRPLAEPTIPRTAVEAFLERAAERHSGLWSKRFTEEPGGIARLAGEALERLEAMGLAELRPEGAVPLPALARYEAREVPERDDGAAAEADGADARNRNGEGSP
ncbi:MAG: TIGR02678 family protein [Acidobacteriota bacterium]|jgi:uncharacterized protein (TIGR02678 family)